MEIHSEPTLTLPKDSDEVHREYLASFTGIVDEKPQAAADFFDRIHPDQLWQDDTVTNPYEARLVDVTKPVIEHEIDLNAEPDSSTAQAMRGGVETAIRQSGPLGERRRTLRLAVYAGQVAMWQAAQGRGNKTNKTDINLPSIPGQSTPPSKGGVAPSIPNSA
jgi:hypothetical protein